MVGSTLHHASIVNGISGGAPLGWAEDITIDDQLPDPAAVARLVERGVNLICLHLELPAARRREIIDQLLGRHEASLVFSDGEGDAILRLR